MYQLICLGDRDDGRMRELVDAVEVSMRALTVDPTRWLEVPTVAKEPEWRHPVVGVWFASDTAPTAPGARNLLSRLLHNGCAVFPVLHDLDDFGRLVPDELRRINGFEWQPGGRRLAGDVLRAFGLTRQQRAAFISYRRSDSRAVAVQLFHGLTDHGYRAFLDTASTDFGVDFQEVLWDRMSDADLVVFIDSPHALTSRWVEDELTRANNLGLGVLQVVWPGCEPFAGTDLSTRFRLAEDDFMADWPSSHATNAMPNPDGRLTEEALGELVDTAEQVRMRSLGSRRTRIVGEIVGSASRNGLSAAVDPRGPVRLAGSGSGAHRSGIAMPVVGLPTAETIFEAASGQAGGSGFRVIYDGLGASSERRRFLEWLNRQVPHFRSHTVDTIDTWLGAL